MTESEFNEAVAAEVARFNADLEKWSAGSIKRINLAADCIIALAGLGGISSVVMSILRLPFYWAPILIGPTLMVVVSLSGGFARFRLPAPQLPNFDRIRQELQG